MKTHNQKLEQQRQFKLEYANLHKMKDTLDYFFGFGALSIRHLANADFEYHFYKMIEIWKNLPVKPEWLRATDFFDYKKMYIENKGDIQPL